MNVATRHHPQFTAALLSVVVVLGSGAITSCAAVGDTGVTQSQDGKTSATPSTSLDQLARALQDVGNMRRVQESIVMSLPDSQLFEDAHPDTLTDAGTARLDKIGLALREHADTRIYIEEYVPARNPSAHATRQAMLQADLIRNELIKRGISTDRLVVDIGSVSTRAAPAGNETGLLHSFKLRIVPLE